MELLTRDEFRESVFKRDNFKCVICGAKAKDAHHILERRLFPDGGYYIDNGASLCHHCHFKAEQTIISCGTIRSYAKIYKRILPPHLYEEFIYDKWGNIMLENGKRLKGELFYDESVQKILESGNVLDQFQKYIKYPRTYHLPWSETITKDDRRLENTKHFDGKTVVVSVKMDGEQTSMYSDYIHARSLESDNHVSRTWVKNLHSQIKYEIPEDWRICGENLYAKHSIHYHNLNSYFYIFSIWNEKNECLSWYDTMEWASLLNLELVPTLYIGIYDEEKIKKLYTPIFNGDNMEGYVIRIYDSFPYSQFKNSMAKFVRANHVTSVHNWKFERIIPNKLLEIKS